MARAKNKPNKCKMSLCYGDNVTYSVVCDRIAILIRVKASRHVSEVE